MPKPKRKAAVRCRGGGVTLPDIAPSGGAESVIDCRSAAETAAGCAEGCIGLGSCVKACRFHAIAIGSNGAAVVDDSKCVGCGMCVKACPRGVITLVPADTMIFPLCQNSLAGKSARQICPSSCVACRICENVCPVGAMSVTGNHAVINIEKCVGCGMCAVKCPRSVITDFGGLFAH